MDAALLFALCAAGFGAEPLPTLNQPRPRAALPVPNGVVAAGYSAPIATEDRLMIPPAPLPNFSHGESSQLPLSSSAPEWCTDSKVCPPAPPAELDVAESPAATIEIDGRRFRVQLKAMQIQGAAACDEPDFAPAGSVMTKDQLRHLRLAIGHLEAAGMSDAAQDLNQRFHTAAARRREQLQRELALKQEALRQLSADIDALAGELTNDLEDNDAAAMPSTSGSVDLIGVFEPLSPAHPSFELVDPAPLMNLDGPALLPPFRLIPSPMTEGRPQLLFPTAPMKSVEPAPTELDFEPPPPPSAPDADADDDPVA